MEKSTAAHAEGDYSILAAAAQDAERTISLSIKAMGEKGEPLDLRMFSLAVSTLRRLVDMRAALRSLMQSPGEDDDSAAVEAELERALKKYDRGEEADDAL